MSICAGAVRRWRLGEPHEALGDMKERHRALPPDLLADANHFTITVMSCMDHLDSGPSPTVSRCPT